VVRFIIARQGIKPLVGHLAAAKAVAPDNIDERGCGASIS